MRIESSRINSILCKQLRQIEEREFSFVFYLCNIIGIDINIKLSI